MDAPDFLPWFKRKPHIIILSHPVQSYKTSGLLENRESKGYTFIVHTPLLETALELSHVVRFALSIGMLKCPCFPKPMLREWLSVQHGIAIEREQ